MSYTIQNLKQDLEGVLHGTTVNQITNLNGLINRASRQFLLDLDPQEMKRINQFTNPIFNAIYDYALPVDLKGNKIIDIRPQVNRQLNEVFVQDYGQAFDLNKLLTRQDQFTINFNSGIKTVRINAPSIRPGVTINDASSPTSNGVWSAGGGASSIGTDNVNFVSNGGAITCNLLAGQASGYLENSTMGLSDLTSHLNQSTLFLWTYLPTASSVTSVELRWGSSASNYYSRTATLTQTGTAFQNGWNLLSFNWLGSTVVGTPDVTKINYLRVTWNYDSTLQTGVHLDNVISNLGSILEIVYYSKNLFKDSSTSAWQETVTDDSNIINLDTDSYKIFFDLVSFLCIQQQQGADALFYDGNFFGQQYQAGLLRYKSLYKSEIQKPQQIYYKPNQPAYNKYINGRSYGNNP